MRKIVCSFLLALFVSAALARAQSDPGTETAYAWYFIQGHRVGYLGDITICTEPQSISHTKGDRYLFAPADVQKRTETAVNDYLEHLDPTGQSKLYMGELEEHEHCNLGTLDQTLQKIQTGMNGQHQRDLGIPNPYGWHKVVLLDVQTGKIMRELTVDKARLPSGGSSAR